MKPIAFRVYTDGVRIKVAAEGDDESHTTFEIYRSDGIGRQRADGGALEVIPGLQATSHTGGVLRHLRLSRESMTITTFPGGFRSNDRESMRLPPSPNRWSLSAATPVQSPMNPMPAQQTTQPDNPDGGGMPSLPTVAVAFIR